MTRMHAAVLPAVLLAATPLQEEIDIPGAKKGPPVHRIIVKDEPRLNGLKFAAVEGKADARGYRFLVPSLDVMQPVGVLLVALDGGNDLELALFKDDFEKPVKQATTNDRSTARFQIRTMGPLRIKVSSTSGVKRYQLLVVVGKETKPAVPSLYVPVSMAGTPIAANAAAATNTSDSASRASGGSSMVMWIIAGSLVLIVAMLGLMLLRKGKSQRIVSVLFVIAIPVAAVSVLHAQGTLSEEAQNYDPLKPEPVSYQDIVDEGVEWAKWVMEKQNEHSKAILELFEALTPRDETLEPQYAGMPGIPTACVSKIPPGTPAGINEVDWTGPCGECFAEAHDSVATTLQRFEKLRRVNAQTKDIYDKSIAFGDGVAGVGGVIAASGWMKVRQGIRDKMDEYYVTYDDKVEELSGALVSALHKVAACEAKYFNNQSWYDRYGFMFVTPIVDRHRR